MYENEIIHFIGGTTDYIGELDQGDHPNGIGWWRIKNPCLSIQAPSMEGANLDIQIGRLGGPDGVYQAYVDLHIPPGIAFSEIRVLTKGGILHDLYMQEIADNG